jgi:acetyltransferase-like isoleucine patch superfamily enzyme
MGTIRMIFKQIHEKILLKCSLEQRSNYLRRQGLKVGKNCHINTMLFSTEPYLIEIGDLARIAGGVNFITHDGSISCFRDELKGDILGRIKIGNNVFIGTNCIILPNTTIGDNCIVGAGSIVRGHFPQNSVIIGNPAKVVLNMNVQKMLFRNSPGFVSTKNLSPEEKAKKIKKHFGIE